MVTMAGVALAVLLLIVALAAFQLRYRSLPAELQPSRMYNLLLWLSIMAIVGVGRRAALS